MTAHGQRHARGSHDPHDAALPADLASALAEIVPPGGSFRHREHIHLAYLAVQRHGADRAAGAVSGWIRHPRSRRSWRWPRSGRRWCGWRRRWRTRRSPTGWPRRTCQRSGPASAREIGRRLIAAYLTVPAYAAFHEWLGRGPKLAGMWDAWKRGDRKAAVAAIPDEVVDELIVHGSPDQCRAHIQRYVDAGVDTPALAILPLGVDARQATRDLAPKS